MEIKHAILEGLKELARIMVLAAVPILIDGLQAGRVNWDLVGVAVAIAGLKFVDKVAHKSDVPVKGLLPF
jgi:hypothetical protein